MQSIVDGVMNLVWGIASVLLPPTILLLVLRKLMPPFGDALWRGYCQLLTWLVVAPVRLIRLVFRELAGRNRR